MGAQIHAIESTPTLPLAELHRRLSAWREAGRPGNKIPDELWTAAVDQARSEGVRSVAMALGLDATKLRRLLRSSTHGESQSRTASSDSLSPTQESPRFLELTGNRHAPILEAASIELAFPDGRRITLRGMSHETVVALCQTFWTADR